MHFEYPDEFDPQPELRGLDLALRPLAELDRRELAAAAGDPGIWAGHPNPDRHKQDVFDQYFDFLLRMGGCLVITREASGAVIGCSAFYTDTTAPSRLSIGFTFLVRKHWGGRTNRDLKQLMLDHVFSHASEAWFHIAPTNLRSQAATRKFGAVQTHEEEIDLGGGV